MNIILLSMKFIGCVKVEKNVRARSLKGLSQFNVAPFKISKESWRAGSLSGMTRTEC